MPRPHRVPLFRPATTRRLDRLGHRRPRHGTGKDPSEGTSVRIHGCSAEFRVRRVNDRIQVRCGSVLLSLDADEAHDLADQLHDAAEQLPTEENQ